MVKSFYINGMTCINCQNRIEDRIKNLSGVEEVHVNFRSGAAQIRFDEKKISFMRIEKEIGKLGRKNGIKAICLLTAIIALYILLQQFGILNLLVPSRLADSSMGYGMLFVIGLLTSIHCVAMCGGIHLSQCLPKKRIGRKREKGSCFSPVHTL